MVPSESPEAKSSDMTGAVIESRHQAALAAMMSLPVARLERPATIVLPEEHRAGSGLVVAYEIRQLTCLRADPALAGAAEELADPTRAMSLDEVLRWATRSGWESMDGADHHVIAASELGCPPTPSGARLVSLDRDNPEHRDRIAELIEACDTEGLEEAELAMDDLDPIIVALSERNGRLGAYASGRRWEEDERFDDIGVITRNDLRGQGWGSAVVAAFCRTSFELDRIPLYRCDWSRTASKALALGLGFKRTISLVALRPHPG